jgi:hypothetical protein
MEVSAHTALGVLAVIVNLWATINDLDLKTQTVG